MGDNKFYLTQQGLKKLEQEYKQLKVLRSRMVGKEETPSVLHSDELDAEFVSFRDDLDLLDSRLEDLEHIFNNYEIIKASAVEDKSKISLGAQIKLDINGKEDEFVIVGTLEADPMAGKISNESPIGKALLGHKAGDKINVDSDDKTTYVIKQVKY